MRWVAVVVLAVVASPASAADPPDFNRDVRPILAARCFKCHGPDDAARKAKLRLDTRDGAEAVLGKPDTSELVRRVFSDDETEVMPPPATKVTLTAKEKETLKAWVAAGAKYDPHWAFVPPKRPVVPVLSTQYSVPGNPIDAFVRARLEKEGLTPSPPADKHTLLRRVYLDLIGIPPTPAEVDAFLKDTSPDAYERVVDRLLASPHYGERWARKWLDLARYADTNGYEKDRQRSVWPYRDWVIKAINADLPFDQFTIQQLAGDMLPGAKRENLVATGFHRNTMLNEEGGIDPLEFRYYAVVDRVSTTATTWLGLTLGCAQCHTHKFDPLTHTDYFRLFAFLNNADEPEMPLPTAETNAKRAAVEAQIIKVEVARDWKAATDEMRKAFAAWEERQRKIATAWTVVRPAKLDGVLTKLEVQADGSVFASGDTTKRDVYTLTFENLPPGVTAIRLEALPDERLPANGPGRTYYEGPKGDFLLTELTLAAGDQPVKFASATETGAKDAAAKAIDGNPLTGWAANGRFGKPRQAVFKLAKPLGGETATLELVFEKYYAASLGRFRVSVTTAADVPAIDAPGPVEDALATPPEKRTEAQFVAIRRHWRETADEFKAEREEIEALRNKMPAPPTTLVMRERPADHPRATFRHHRGEFLQPKEEVKPGVPAILPPLAKDAPANRLGFAKWLVSRDNPLTARVTVNRHWQAFFGRGLVRTVDDFGYQGETPTHPELLDWLAVEFQDPSPNPLPRGERGLQSPPSLPGKGAGGLGRPEPWSVKRLHRLIVTSATYRQSSRVTPELLAKDAENKLLARGPRVRLDSEQIRDSALKAAGLLSPKMYGPSVFPPQPANVTTEGAYGRLDWKVSEGEDRYRRGLYTFAKRTMPFAMAGTFDAPSGEACVARREVTNSALQALTMLNDVVLLDVARALGRRLAEHDGTTAGRVDLLFRLCLVRPPTADEAARVAKFFEAQREKLATDPDRSDAIAGPPNGTEKTKAADRAAWTATARAVLNLDEFVTKE